MHRALTWLRRRAWRSWYRLRWVAWQRRQADRARRRTLRGLKVTVLPGVLDPTWFFSSEVLVDALDREVRPGDRVLDLGTGTGIAALAAMRGGAGAVVATDIDPVAVACAQANLEQIVATDRPAVRQGDLFDPVAGERFDVVAFNPPWLAVGDARHRVALQLDPRVPLRFAEGLSGHLTPMGRGVIVLSTAGDAEAWLGPIRERGHGTEQLLVRDRGSEVLTAWRIGRAEEFSRADV
jgi:release factor glutamine methyltransferase